MNGLGLVSTEVLGDGREGLQLRSKPNEYIYVVDERNIILEVSENWQTFADRNAAGGLTRASVVGKPLLDFFEGSETRHLYEILMDKARRTNQKLVIPFRCDGPCVRRYMKLSIVPMKDGKLEFTSLCAREESRPVIQLLDTSIERSDGSIELCSWCKSVKAGEKWIEVEPAIYRLNLFQTTPLPKLNHSICSSCEDMLMKEIEDVVELLPWPIWPDHNFWNWVRGSG